MTTALLVLLAVAALSASLALLVAQLGVALLADALAVTAALCGVSAFGLVAVHTMRRARRPDHRLRP